MKDQSAFNVGPLPARQLPPPSIGRGRIVLNQVLIGSKVSTKQCLEVFDPVTSVVECIYEINRVLKETIYGNILHAVVLKVHPDNPNVFLRSTQFVAIKVYYLPKLNALRGRTEENPRQELATLQYLQNHGGHINIVGSISCVADNEAIYSILEFCDGSELYDILASNGPFNDADAQFIFRQICDGMKFLHTLGISHRDSSLENIMLCKNGICKFIDFGMSLAVTQTEVSPGRNVNHLLPKLAVCGKKNYIPPEVLRQQQPIDALHIDTWSLAIKLFMMLTGVPPFDCALDVDARYRMVTAGRVDELLRQWQINLHPLAIDLLKKLFTVEPTQRMSFESIMDHPWMQLPESSRFPEASALLANSHQRVCDYPPVLHGS